VGELYIMGVYPTFRGEGQFLVKRLERYIRERKDREQERVYLRERKRGEEREKGSF
jgi:hypothetical protein